MNFSEIIKQAAFPLARDAGYGGRHLQRIKDAMTLQRPVMREKYETYMVKFTTTHKVTLLRGEIAPMALGAATQSVHSGWWGRFYCYDARSISTYPANSPCTNAILARMGRTLISER